MHSYYFCACGSSRNESSPIKGIETTTLTATEYVSSSRNESSPIKGIETPSTLGNQLTNFSRRNESSPIKGIETPRNRKRLSVEMKVPRLRGLKHTK